MLHSKHAIVLISPRTMTIMPDNVCSKCGKPLKGEPVGYYLTLCKDCENLWVMRIEANWAEHLKAKGGNLPKKQYTPN